MLISKISNLNKNHNLNKNLKYASPALDEYGKIGIPCQGIEIPFQGIETSSIKF